MKKQLITIALGLSSLSAPYVLAQTPMPPESAFIELNKLKYGADFVAVGNINVNVSEKIKLNPDTAEFSITYTTEDKSFVDASNTNVTNMKTLKTYLESLGINKDDLTTVGYKNYENMTDQPIANQTKLYKTTITVNAVINDNNKFYDAIQILEKNGIVSLEKQASNNTFYTFTINEKASDATAAKQLAQTKYKAIEEQFKKNNIAELTIEKYSNNQDEEKQQVKLYYVENTLKIKTKNFDNLGKIIAKAQELKMNVNNDMSYSVSDTTRNQAIEKSQSQLLEKLTQKAQLLLTAQDYRLGAPKDLNVSESDIGIMPPRPRNIAMMAMADKAYAKEAVDIQPPADFEIMVTLSGSFDILKKTYKQPN